MKMVIPGGAGFPATTDSNSNLAANTVQSENPADVKQRHNRYITGVDNTHPGNETAHKVTWDNDENVRRYRILAIGGSAGDYLRVVEDAQTGGQADTWLTEAASVNADVEYWIALAGAWTEWKELSKSSLDTALQRLDFEASAAGPFTVFVEAE